MGGSTTNKTKPDNTAFHGTVASLVCEKSRNARTDLVRGASEKYLSFMARNEGRQQVDDCDRDEGRPCGIG